MSSLPMGKGATKKTLPPRTTLFEKKSKSLEALTREEGDAFDKKIVC